MTTIHETGRGARGRAGGGGLDQAPSFDEILGRYVDVLASLHGAEGTDDERRVRGGARALACAPRGAGLARVACARGKCHFKPSGARRTFAAAASSAPGALPWSGRAATD